MIFDANTQYRALLFQELAIHHGHLFEPIQSNQGLIDQYHFLF
ncbi:hypothetical protein CPter91_0949 [Collimonas pratensis]|uniref:Uncharacterized protein n=1 Tax=Collimonas pratensis TaxID=279113 RepID=A0A127PZY6_9BURK|nr:hypothetical protein CPter91_0949 [Collimonas pratensis]